MDKRTDCPFRAGDHIAADYYTPTGEGNMIWEGVKGTLLTSPHACEPWYVEADDGAILALNPCASALRLIVRVNGGTEE